MRRGGIYAKGLFNPDDNSVIVLKGSTVNLNTILGKIGRNFLLGNCGRVL